MSPPPRILLQGAHVVTMDDAHTSMPLDLRIEQGRITGMAPTLPERGVDRIVRAKGLIAMPGMVQAHIHLCQTLFRGQADDMDLMEWLRRRIWPMEASLDAAALEASARLGLAELLLGGTTAILDMGTVRHTEALFIAARDMGMRYTGGKTLMDLGQGLPPGLREDTDAAIAESMALCETWHESEGGRLRYAFSPRFAVCCTDKAIAGCIKLARKYGALLHTHAAENTEEVQTMRQRTGMGSVEYLHSLGFLGPDAVVAHAVWINSNEQRLLRDTHTRVAHCPASNLKLASGIARIDELLAQDIHVALGSDGAACSNTLDMFMQMRLAALLHKVRGGPTAVTARQALRMATRGGAEALGLGGCGHIALGQRADIVLLDLYKPHVYPDISDLASRIVYAAQSSDVHTVLINGGVVVDAGKLQTGNLESIMVTAQAMASDVLARSSSP